MYMKYVRLLFLICASVMYVGCSEDPFDWSGDSERSVPIPVDLSLEVVEDIVSASCGIEYHEEDVKCDIKNNKFSSSSIGVYSGERVKYSYVGAYITTSRGTATIGPELAQYRW